MLGKVLFAIYVIYCFEVGVFLIIFPWMEFWNQNLLLSYYPALRPVLLNGFVRGAVSGLGFANLILGGWEIAGYKKHFRRTGTDTSDPIRHQ